MGLASIWGTSSSLEAIDFTVPGGGSVTFSASHDQYPGPLAFDDGGDLQGSRWLPLQSEFPNVFIQYDFGSARSITQYTIQNQDFDFAPRSPKDWKLQGSNDATDWVDVDTVTEETDWTAWEKRTFAVDTPGDYRYYKLLISAANGANTYLGIGEIELGIPLADVPAAEWTVSHLTGDGDSLVSSSLQYTTAVNVHGTQDRVVNGVTFKAESGTSGEGWEISENFQTQHNGQVSTVTGAIGEVLSDRMRYNGDPQKLKMKNLIPGETYIFSIYNQAWSVGENRTAVLSLTGADETITVNQGEFASEAQDGQVVQCKYMATSTEVEFTVDPTTTATWHLYGFSNALFSPLLPSYELDNTDPNAQVVTLEWLEDVTEFTADDIIVEGATLSNFQEVSARKHTFTLTPADVLVQISITIEAAKLMVGGKDNKTFFRTFQHYHPVFEYKETPLTFFTEDVGKAPVVWFDAGDAASVTSDAHVTMWEDKSGNERHATHGGGTPAYNPTGGPAGGPIIEIRRAGGNDFLSIGGEAFLAKDHYYVFRSADPADRWDYYGGVLGHQSGRGSNYLFENNNRNFHGNQAPEMVYKNGYALSANPSLSIVNEFMIVRIIVNNNSTGLKTNYRIGTIDNSFCASVDIAEVVAFDSVLSDEGRQKLEGYLARKWGLVDKIAADHPYRSEPPVITLSGEDYVRISVGDDFTDPGATATDAEDGDLDGSIVITYLQPPFDPQDPLDVDTYPGLQLWLKADEGFSPGGWSDQSLAGNDATAHGDPGPQLVDGVLNGLPVMRYSGTDGQYHSFPNMTDIRTVFWVTKRNSGPGFLLGDNNQYHFHSNNGVAFINQHSHANIKGGRFAIAGEVADGLSVNVPTEMSVLSLRTTGNVEASNFSNDRNIAGRYWNGDLAELLIYNQALADHEIADVEARLGQKWGLPYVKPAALVDAFDSTVLGDWVITYSVTDSTGGTDSIQRIVHVFDPDAPIITLLGDAEHHHELNTVYEDPGYIVKDASGQTLDASEVVVTGSVVGDVPGEYTLAYDFTDSQGRPAVTKYRVVEVSDTLPPVITLTDGEIIKHPLGQPFIDPGATATDLVEGEVPVSSSLLEFGIRHQGYLLGSGDHYLNFNNNGGLMVQQPVGENILKTALNFGNDAAFMDAGVGINREDNFNNLFTGLFHAKVSGEYEFQLSGRDDRGSLWLDLNRNGGFEENGNAGNEWINGGYYEGGRAVQLSPGLYPFAVGHTEHGGGSRIMVAFRTPEGGGPTTLAFMDPSQPNQEGLWVLENPLNTGIPGIQTITYTASDSLGNKTTVIRTVEIIDATALPVITLEGRPIMKHEQYTEFVEPGFLVEDADGNPLDASGVKVTGHFDVNAAGVYELLYSFTDENGIPAVPKTRIVEVVDTIAPSVTIVGDAEMEHVQGTLFTDPGATIGDDPEEGLFVVSTAHFPLDGITYHLDASNISGGQPGDALSVWPDISGNDLHFTDVIGAPVLVADGIGGLPSVRFTVEDMLASTHHVDRKYSIVTVSRWDGVSRGRMFGSKDRNWLMGYWNGREDAYHPEGWATSYNINGTTNPHVYSATSTGGNSVRFYGDFRDLTTNTARNGLIGKLQLAGQGNGGESASGDISEVLVFKDYVLPDDQRRTLEGMLAIKYGILGYPQLEWPDLNKVGVHTIHYSVRDKTGNVGLATRQVTVTPDPEIPIITLNGDQVLHHEAATDFTDPGATVKDGDGNELDASGLVVTGTVNTAVPGIYYLNYNYTAPGDKHAEEVIRNVVVADTQGPELTLTGDELVRIQVGEDYTDAGITAHDVFDGDHSIYSEKDIPADGLVLHLDAGAFIGTLADGDLVTTWPDLSGQGNHADNTSGDPKWVASGLNRRPVVNFDGDDLIWTTKNFETDLANYTIISVARYTGGDSERVISARNRNYILGFHGGVVRRFFSDGWASNQGGGDTLWHIHVGTVNNQDQANFWMDATQYANNHNGLNNTTYMPDQIQLGGWRTNAEMSKCEVAELIVYNRVVTEEERNTLTSILNAKYGLWLGGGFAYTTVDTSEAASHTIRYIASDKAGNVSEITRTVVVSADPTKPYIVMNGDILVSVQAGSLDTYVDPGAVAKAEDGTTLKEDLVGVGDIDMMTTGTYTLTYNFTDGDGNAADTAIRTIQVVDTEGPSITLNDEDPLTLFIDAPFQDPGATSTDLRDGDVPVYSDYLVIPDSMRFEYHVQGNNVANLLFENNGGVLSKRPYLTTYITDGPNGDGINFLSDQDFMGITGWYNRWDTYQVVFSANLEARRDGDYGFSASKQDGNDYCTIWVDRDRDGLLERDGDFGDEQVVWDNQINTVYLEKDSYPVYIGYSEWNGNSRFNARFHTPDGAGPSTLTTIHPGGPGQEGLWNTFPKKIDTSVPGEHTITYFADDQSGNRTTLTRKVEVVEDTMKPVILLLGDKAIEHHAGFPYKDPGVLLDDYQGNALDESLVQVTGVPDGMTLGSFTIRYEYTDPDEHMADPVTRTVLVQDIVAPVITINGANPATVRLGEPYMDAGAFAVDAFDGSVSVVHNMGFEKEGLVLHLDAGSFKGTLNDGDVISIDWEDLSSNGNHGDNQVGDPKWIENGLNGEPVVDFNGDDMIWTTKNFEPDLANYSIFTVARYTANDTRGRVIGSKDRNWLFAFHGNSIRQFFSDGWGYNAGGADTNWHIHYGNVNDVDQGNFWLDGAHLGKNFHGLHDTNYKPRNINLGGANLGGNDIQLSKCQIAELIMFDRVLNSEEREYIELYLKSKYNLNGGGNLAFFSKVDTSREGDYTFDYIAEDRNGNISKVSRTVKVVNENNLPVITLTGDPEVIHSSGQPYVDEGATVANILGIPLDVADLVISDGVNSDLPGEYVYSYDYTDQDGNRAVTAIRQVTVIDQTPPEITLKGEETIIHQLGNHFAYQGASAVDLVDGELPVISSMLIENKIRVRGYMFGHNEALLNLDGDGGLLKEVPVGERLDFASRTYLNGDASFRAVIKEITRNDHFQVILDGHFHTTSGGLYEFGMEQPDDRAAFWLDLDRDGVFELDGDRGSELMNSGYQFGYRQAQLAPGYHRYAIAFSEHGGGSRVDARYRAIQGEGPGIRSWIDPSNALQQGQWVIYNPINVLAPGEHTITYTATDQAGNVGTAIRTVIVKNNPDAGIITLNGEEEMTVGLDSIYTEPGATIADIDGNSLSTDNLVVSGTVNTGKVGNYYLEYNYTTDDGIPSRTKHRTVIVADLETPEITLNGDAEVTVFQGSEYVDEGATATDNLDGDFVLLGTSELFPQEGLFTHLDASRILGKSDGDVISIWYDQSPAGNHANNAKGTPAFLSSAIGGLPAVTFDGLSSLALSVAIDQTYTIFAVSRVTGDNPQRFLTSQDQNWLFGYHSGFQHRFHPVNGWATATEIPATEDPQLYSATSGDLRVRFYANGRDLTALPIRRDTNYRMGYFQMGVWLDGRESSSGEVSEVIIYNRILTNAERMGVEARLNAKYGLNGVQQTTAPVDTGKLGEYHVVYQSVDSAGNVASKMRKVTVVEDPNAPSITLTGEAFVIHEAGETYTDAGAVLKDAQDNILDASLMDITQDLDPNTEGQYTLTYSYTPESGAPAVPVTRIIEVEDTQAPVLTLNGAEVVKLTVGADYVEEGATATDLASGDLFVFNPLEHTFGELDHHGYMETSNDVFLNLANDGGIIAEKIVGSAKLTTGPDNSGLDFDSDAEFRAAIPGITRNDNYQNLFTGIFFAPEAGRYGFNVNHRDDRAAIWLDLDQDWVFESAGDLGNEQIRDGLTLGTQLVDLAVGYYRIAIMHMEYGGGSGAHVRFNLPSGGLQNIHPASQSTFWASKHDPILDTSQAGTHTIEYKAYDAAGNLGTVTRTVFVVEDATVPFIALEGGLEMEHELGTPFTDPGAVVTDDAGEVLKSDLAGQGTVDVNALGEYSLTYDYTDPNTSKAAVQVIRTVRVVDTTAPAITVKPHPTFGGTDTVELTVGQDWVDPGIDITDADGSAWFVSSRDYIPNRLFQAGFKDNMNNGNIANVDNNGGLLTVTPTGTSAFIGGPLDKGFNYEREADVHRSPIGINTNDRFAFYVLGYFHARVTGEYSFQSDADDLLSVWLDLDQDGIFSTISPLGNERLIWGGNAQSLSVTLDPGHYRFIAAHYEGGGGMRAKLWVKTPEGAGPTELEFVKPAAPSQGGLWSMEGDGPINTTYPGTHTITYYAMDHSGHMTTATRTVIVKEDPDAPVLTLVGESEIQHQIGTDYTDELPTIAEAHGTAIDDQANIVTTVTLDDSPVAGVNQDVAGIYHVQYDYTDGNSKKAIPVNRIVTVGDFLPPVITLLGDNPFNLTPGYEYIEPGATATDTIDGDLTVTLPPLDFSTAAEAIYHLEYTATDAAGNTTTVTRELIIKDDPNRPFITLIDGESLVHEAGEPFVDPGVIVTNGRGHDLDESIVTVTGDVDHTALGTYTLSYDYDDNGNTASTIHREVTVVDTTAPKITLEGGTHYRASIGATFSEPGYTVTDNLDTDLTAQVLFISDGEQPVVHWEFDETDGDVAKDLMNGIDGTLRNFPTPLADNWVAGKYGNALKFDANNASYVSLPGTGVLDLPELTISVWINTDDILRNMFIFEKTADNTLNSQYNLHFDSQDEFLFRINDGISTFKDAKITTSDEFLADQWEHIAVTYDGSVQRVFINTVLVAQVQQDITLPLSPTGPSYIGAFAPGDGYHFTGLMDDLKIYDKAIPEDQINSIRSRSGVDTSKEQKSPFTLSYTSTDSNGNSTTVYRKVVVSDDDEPPVLTLSGSAIVHLEIGEEFIDEKAIAIDEVDQNLTPFVEINGTVDTSKAGTYIITYDVMDYSYNKAEQVSRTVIVGDPPQENPLAEWKTTHLFSLSADDQKMDADPDQDGLKNLIEYALNADPNNPDSHTKLPTLDDSSGSLKVTFLRYKTPADYGISYHVELSTNLISGTWSEAAVTIEVDTNQDGVPANFEKVTATANTSIANETSGQQFLRIRVQEL